MGRSRFTRLAGILLACALLSACGSSEQVRPKIVDSYPAHGQILTGPVQEIRVTYDGPVRILNPFDVRLFGESVGFLNARVRQRPGDSHSVYITPTDAVTFPLDDAVTVLIIEGLVVNDLDHYAKEDISFNFFPGLEPPLLFGRPGMVTLLDSATFASLGDVPTPGGRDPAGVVSTIRGTTQRVWVQLVDGGGTGESIAWFEPGDATMTAIDLPATLDLATTASAISVDPQGTYVYAAFRDTDTGGVRLVRIDTATALPAGHLDLTAIAPGASTTPIDLRWGEGGEDLIVMAAEGSGGRFAQVQRETFTEIDRDEGAAGIQGLASPSAGRFVSAGLLYWVSRPGSGDGDVVDAFTGSVGLEESTLTGTNVDVLAMPAGPFTVQGLAGYAGDTALRIRTTISGFFEDTSADVSDDVGGVDRAATSVVALQFLPGVSRFAVLLDSPGGLLLTRFQYAPFGILQDDLDTLTAGTQAVDVEAVVSGATIIGRTFGSFPP